jgi:hypothetical protein
MEELRQFYRFRPDEIFRRVTVSSLVGLMVEVSKLEYQVTTLARLRGPESGNKCGQKWRKLTIFEFFHGNCLFC